MLNFYFKNSEPFWSLTKNYLWLDRDKSIMPTILVSVVYKCAVSSIQKNNYVQKMFQSLSVKVHVCTSIS